MKKDETYTTYGPIRGDCGHKHKTHNAAQRCAERDNRDCHKAGGYSDRSIYAESTVERNFVGDVYWTAKK